MISNPQVKAVNATLNFTGRSTILRNRITVDLVYPADSGSPVLNSLELNLEGMGLPENALVFADFWSSSPLHREEVEVGRVADPIITHPVSLDRIGRTSCKMVISVTQQDGLILACAKKIYFSPPDSEEDGPDDEGDGLSWVEHANTVKLVGWERCPDLGPDRLLSIRYPEGGEKPQAVILVNDRCTKGWARVHQTPEHAFRKIVLEFALGGMIDRVVEEAKDGNYDPSDPLDIHSRWAPRMHDWFAEGGAGRLSEVDMEDEDEISEWKRRAFERWSSGKTTPLGTNAMLGGGF